MALCGRPLTSAGERPQPLPDTQWVAMRSVSPISDEVARERLEALWNAHYAEVFAFALRRLGDREAALDAAAETFLVAWRRLDAVPDMSRAWLFGVAIKVMANTRRGRRRGDALIARLELTRDPVTPVESVGDPTTAQVLAATSVLLEAQPYVDGRNVGSVVVESADRVPSLTARP